MDILFEDNHLIVVSKPQNVPSQPDQSNDKDMLTMVKEYIKEKYNKPGNVYVGLIHRLDRPTGGIMAFAKTSKCASRLSEQFANGEAEKTYLAVVVGKPRDRRGRLVHYLIKDTTANKVELAPQLTEGAKKAELEYEVLESDDEYSLIKIGLLTGRSHQARIQMKTLGTPIFGDVKYGGEKAQKGLLNLFAVQLIIYHPITKEKMTFINYPPETEKMWNRFNLEKHLRIQQSQ